MYLLIDFKPGDMFEEPINAKNDEDAIALATKAWEHLTGYEQKHRIEFFLVRATKDYDPEDCTFLEATTEIWRAK